MAPNRRRNDHTEGVSRTRRRSTPWLVTAVGGDAITQYRDAFVALFVAVIASLVAGITLATTTDTLEELPGLLLLVPAALAVKGNIFGALGSRLGTSIHTGVFQLSPRLDTVVGQNTAAALILSLVVSVELALLAKGVAIVFNVSPPMSTIDFITVSAVGGASPPWSCSGSPRHGERLGPLWVDLDNVVAPLVTATGDVITLPAWCGQQLTGRGGIRDPSLWSCRSYPSSVSGGRCVPTTPSPRRDAKSLPILTVAGILDLIAGITIEKRLEDFIEFPVLLILLPGFLGTAGALGGVLSSRLATKVHLGLVQPGALPCQRVGHRDDFHAAFRFRGRRRRCRSRRLITGRRVRSRQSRRAVLGQVVGLAGGRIVGFYSTVVAIRSRPGYLRHPDGDLVARFRQRCEILALAAVGVA